MFESTGEHRRLGALTLSIASTALIFVVIPLGVIALVGSLVLAGSGRHRQARRYRPGRPYDFRPVWFLASPERAGRPFGGPADQHTPADRHTALEASSVRRAPVLGTAAPEGWSPARRAVPGSVGGASDSW